MSTPSSPAQRNSQATNALILGIAAIVFGALASASGVISYVGFAAPVAALLALWAALRGIRAGGQGRTLALLGIAGGVVGVVLFLIPISQGVASVTWNTYTSDKGGFTVSMPGSPQDEDAGNGMRSVTAVSLGMGYVVIYLDTPAGQDPEALLAGIKQGISAQGTLVSDKEVKLGDNPGFQIVFTSASGNETMQNQVTAYVTPTRIYQIMVRANKNNFSQALADQFVTSFKLK